MSADLAARAAVFRALSHPARLALLRLAWTEPLSGETLARLMNLAPATVSHHLAQLAEAGLTTVRPDGHHRLVVANHAALGVTLAALIRGRAPRPPPRTPTGRGCCAPSCKVGASRAFPPSVRSAT